MAEASIEELPVHVGVTCDVSGMSPIVGNRWSLSGRNYDLCDAEYNKLSDEEKESFVLIATPCQRRQAAFVAILGCDGDIVAVQYTADDETLSVRIPNPAAVANFDVVERELEPIEVADLALALDEEQLDMGLRVYDGLPPDLIPIFYCGYEGYDCVYFERDWKCLPSETKQSIVDTARAQANI